MHPLAQDLSSLKDDQIEQKIIELSRKYFQTANGALRQQIQLFLDQYRQELSARRSKQVNEIYQKRPKDLDNLINVD